MGKKERSGIGQVSRPSTEEALRPEKDDEQEDNKDRRICS
jgi:hypothetical protein